MANGGPSIPVFVPNPAPTLGYGGIARTAFGDVTCLGVLLSDTVTIGAVVLTASTAQTPGGLNFDETPAHATGSVTVSSTPLAAGDSISIGGAPLTGVSGSRTPGSDNFSADPVTASGMANEIVAALNDPANSFAVTVTAVAVGNVVTLLAVVAGLPGNSITLAASTTPPGGLTVSGPFLTGGITDPDISAATSLAAAINDTGNGLSTLVFASTGGTSTVTVAALTPGGAANSVVLASSDAIRLAVSDPTLLGGIDGSGAYGFSPYGQGAFPRLPAPTTGGYGGAPYGTSSYGALDVTQPRASSAVSIDGFTIELFFNEEMDPDSGLFTATNYTLTPILGAPVTVTSVAGGTSGPAGGCTSVIITHSGTTLGGTYTVVAINITDLAGNTIGPPPANNTSLLTLGDTPSFTVAPTGGGTLQVQFTRTGGGSQDMLTEVEFTPGIEDPTSYSFTTTYPISITLGAITHPVSGDASLVDMAVTGMTSAPYTAEISPASSIDYDGDILPSAATTFSGVENGTGSSTANVATGLLLSKAIGVTYGWGFGDTSGRLLPGSTCRTDFQFNAAVAVFVPALFDAIMGTLTVSDGAVEVALLFRRVAGVDVIDVVSGAFSQQVPAIWSTGDVVLSVLRNQQADHYAVLVNGVPLVSVPTASWTGAPTIAAGARFILSTTYAVTQFRIRTVDLTATQTVFSSSWNFLHGVSSSFIGSAANTRDHLLTERGPLVKGWGDATPATKEDVAVRVQGVDVAIREVNPYVGKIFPVIPIPFLPVGTVTVDVDYIWFPNPQMEMAGLNTEGLVLNQWDLHKGHTPPSTNPLPSGSTGVASTARFPLGVVLGPLERPQPIQIGHRYFGFEKAYTAMLNSPTTLLLNANPHRVSVEDFNRSPEGSTGLFDGETTPQAAADIWELDGVDTGAVLGDGTYQIIDASAGSFGDGTAAVYHREEDLSFPNAVTIAGRLLVDDYEADGVFTGVGFGVHDNFRLYLAGLLEINGVKHVGMLLDAELPHEATAWELGPPATIDIIDELAFTIPTVNLPTNVDSGTRFQIFDGVHAGVYIISTAIGDRAGTTTVTLDPMTPLPGDFTLWEADTAEVVFEVLWDASFTSYRMVVDTDGQQAQLIIGGTLSGMAIELTTPTAIPAETSLLIPTGNKGRVMFGSLSRIATNTSTWSFYRYSVAPDQATVHARSIVVAAEMSEPPEDDPNNIWFITQEFGLSKIDSSGDTLLLKSTSESDTLDLTYGYARIEPFLTTKAAIDVDVTFRVDSGILGTGDAVVRVRDDVREVFLTTLLYRLTGGDQKVLDEMSAVSVSGLQDPTDEGWVTATPPTFLLSDVSNQQDILTVNQLLGETGIWAQSLASNPRDSGGRIMDARLRMTSWTANASGLVGTILQTTMGLAAGTTRNIILGFKVAVGADPPRIAVLNSSLVEISTVDFDWTDGAFHNYRVLADNTVGAITISVDDTVLATLADTAFPIGGTEGDAKFGAVFSDVATATEWDSFNVSAIPDATVHRTLAVYRRGDRSDIDSWVIPRTDTTGLPNSDPASVIEDMDWRSYMDIRVHLDPTWGVTILRPDLPPPPGFTGDFATQITEPSAGWINLEYRRMPRHNDMFGSVAFGALTRESVTQQRWQQVRYRIYNHPNEEYISPHHMVLNQFNVIHSGELLFDTTPEVVTITSLTSRLVSVLSANMNADRVFSVVVDGTVLDSSTWVFDQTTQTITLTSPLPADEYPVTVTFAPGKPVTKTYLEAQPLLQSVTLLNEGTPPVPLSQTAESVREVVFGSKINDPNDTLGDPDFILNDDFRIIEFTDDPDALYESLTFCVVDDDGERRALSIACDGPAPGVGLIEIALEGSAFHDGFSVPGGPGGPWGSSSPSIGGSASSFNQTNILHASGGGFVGGVLGPGTAVLYPNWPGPNVSPSDARKLSMGQNQHVAWNIEFTTPFEDVLTMPETADNTPPSGVGIEPNPDGTPGTQLHGAAVAELVDYGATGVSRLGPWGGIDALTPESLLAGSGSTQASTGLPASGMALTLNGGFVLPDPTTTFIAIEAAN